MADRLLSYRILQFVDDQNGKLFGCDQLVEHLRSCYRDYERKKKAPFRIAVEQAYVAIMKKQQQKHGLQLSPHTKSIEKLEAKHLRKRKRQSDHQKVNSSDSSDESFSSNNEEYVEQKDTNTMNSVLTSLYSKNATNKSSSETNGAVQTESGLAFTIDRTGSKNNLSYELPDVRSDCDVAMVVAPDFYCGFGEPNVSKQNDVIMVDDDSRPAEQATMFLSQDVSSQSNTSKNLNMAPVAEVNQLSSTNLQNSATKPKRKQSEPSKGDASSAKQKKKIRFEAQQSTTTLSEVGGNTDAVVDALSLLVHIRHYNQLKIASPSRRFLLYGPSGCGKTLLANAIAGEVGCPLIKLSSTSLVSGVSGESEDSIRSLFEEAMAKAPCVVFIDDIDAITQKRETASKNMEYRIVLQLCSCLDELSSSDKPVFVIGATNRIESLDQALRRPGRFDREIAVGIPDETARRLILGVLSKSYCLSDDVDLRLLAKRTPGYVGTDLKSLMDEAETNRNKRVLEQSELHSPCCKPMCDSNNLPSLPDTGSASESNKNSSSTPDADPRDPRVLKVARLLKVENLLDAVPIEITMSDFEVALRIVQPSAKREGFPTVPDITWEDVGGLHDIRRELEESIIWPAKYPNRCQKVNIECSGILLTGPPGNGKTLLAKAVANESGLNFMYINGPELLNMYVGESERQVRQVFQRAASNIPCVIFFDELDALGHRRQNSDSAGNKVNVVDQLLTELDGFKARKRIFVMGATNRPDMVDKALLRPGRFDKIMFVGLPDESTRLEIIRALSRKYPLSSDVVLADVASNPRCEGMSGADLSQVLKEAGKIAMREMMDALKQSNPDALKSEEQLPDVVVGQNHLLGALARVTPSVSAEDRLLYERMRTLNQLSSERT